MAANWANSTPLKNPLDERTFGNRASRGVQGLQYWIDCETTISDDSHVRRVPSLSAFRLRKVRTLLWGGVGYIAIAAPRNAPLKQYINIGLRGLGNATSGVDAALPLPTSMPRFIGPGVLGATLAFRTRIGRLGR